MNREELIAAGYNPDREIGRSFNVESQQKPSPVDDDGLPMLDTHAIGLVFNRTHNNDKRIPWESGIMQHVEEQGTTGSSRRLWYSHRDVRDHLKSLLEGTAPSFPGKPAQTPEERELMWGAKHRHFDNLVKGAELSQQNKIKNGETVFDLKNQPHRGNEGFFGRTKRGRRLYTDSNGITSPTNNLGAAISQGRFKRLGEEQ
jgi:hypothetical protein